MKIISQKRFGKEGWKFEVEIDGQKIRFETDQHGYNLHGIAGSVGGKDEYEVLRFKDVHLPIERQRARRKLRYLLINK